MRTETITIHTYEELSDKAKAKARDWYREGFEFDPDYVYDDARAIAEMMGIEIAEDGIMYSGFWSQGDGAMFIGNYAYKRDSAKAVRAYAATDEVLHKIVDDLHDLQRRNFYGLVATIERARGYSYYHSGMMDVSARTDRGGYLHYADPAVDELTTILRRFADWIYKSLEAAYEGETTDEAVEDTIIVNEYEFLSDGSRHA